MLLFIHWRLPRAATTGHIRKTRRLLTNRPCLGFVYEEPHPKERLRVNNWIVTCLIAKGSVLRELNDSPLGSLLSTRSTRWSRQDGGPKAEGCNL
jgi:hypothetical protein